MGGKLWTQAEERIFWTVIIPQSPKRVGIDQHNDERSWEQLVNVMNKAMLDATGETDEAKLPRKYTKLSLCKFPLVHLCLSANVRVCQLESHAEPAVLRPRQAQSVKLVC